VFAQRVILYQIRHGLSIGLTKKIGSFCEIFLCLPSHSVKQGHCVPRKRFMHETRRERVFVIKSIPNIRENIHCFQKISVFGHKILRAKTQKSIYFFVELRYNSDVCGINGQARGLHLRLLLIKHC